MRQRPALTNRVKGRPQLHHQLYYIKAESFTCQHWVHVHIPALHALLVRLLRDNGSSVKNNDLDGKG